MEGIRQRLHTAIASDELNERLGAGARVVYLVRKGPEGLWDAVLETEESDFNPRAYVLDFLVNVDAAYLEQKMLENPALDSGPGKAALAALAEMVTGAPA